MGLIGGMAGAAGAGTASILGGIFSSSAASNAYNKYIDLMNQRLDEVKAHRDARYYQDPTQTAESQAAVTQAQQLLNQQTQRAKDTNIVSGGTDESVALQKQAAAAAVGQMMQQQAVEGAEKREQIWDKADSQIDAFTKYKADAIKAQGLSKAQALTNMANGFAKSSIEFGKSMPW